MFTNTNQQILNNVPLKPETRLLPVLPASVWILVSSPGPSSCLVMMSEAMTSEAKMSEVMTSQDVGVSVSVGLMEGEGLRITVRF